VFSVEPNRGEGGSGQAVRCTDVQVLSVITERMKISLGWEVCGCAGVKPGGGEVWPG
jgi:hypothetical protein